MARGVYGPGVQSAEPLAQVLEAGAAAGAGGGAHGPARRRRRARGALDAPRGQTHGRHSHIFGACALAPRPRARPAMAAPRGPTPPPRAAPPRPVLRPRPAPPLGAGTGDMGNSRAMLSVCRPGSVRGTININPLTSIVTSVVREAMERRSAPSPARPATRPRTGRDPRPPLQRDWSAAPPAAPAAPRAAGRPYTEPGRVVRRYHGTFYSFLRGLGFFAGLRGGGVVDSCGARGSCIV